MRGFTLVEVLVSVLILSFLVGGIFLVLSIGNTTYNIDLGVLDLQQQARRAMDGMMRELRQTNEISGEGELDVVSSSMVTFNIPPGNYGGTWVGPITYYLDVANNQIIREYPAGTNRIIANDVNALNFSLSGNVLSIELACAKIAQGKNLSLTVREQVRLRNE